MTVEDLKKRDFYLVIDKSASMEKAVKAGVNRTRWEDAEEVSAAFAKKMTEFDDDGISLVFFSNTVVLKENVKGEKEELANFFKEIEPYGGTATDLALQAIFDAYLAKDPAERKPVIVVVLTDGKPNDQEKLEKAIAEFTKKLNDPLEFGITFVQIGDEQQATEALKHLDDNLTSAAGAKHDIVDTIKSEDIEKSGKSLTDVLLDAVLD